MPVPNKVDTFNYTVEPFDDDFTGRLSWGMLGKHILACAENHAKARGFDRLSLNGHRYLWVLSRMVFEMEEWPHLGDEYTISTWIRRYYRYFTDRYFDIHNAQGNVIGRVFTIWAMIDATTRKPQVLEELFGNTFDPYIETSRPCDVQPFSRIRPIEGPSIYNRTAYYSDTDENDHVNSIRYIEYILDAFPKQLFSTHQISRLEIAYNAESHPGDQLGFFLKEAGKGAYHVIVRKNIASGSEPSGGETVCHSAVTFVPIQPSIES